MSSRSACFSLLAVLLTLSILGFLAGNANAAAITWVGGDVTNPDYWDIGTTANWSPGPTVYTDLVDDVTFDDTSTNLNSVDLRTTLSPNSVVIGSTTTRDYTFAGTGLLTGTTGITKGGSGTLTVNNANTFTGDVTVNDGTLVLGNAAALGTTASDTEINAGGTLELNGIDLKDTHLEKVTAQGVGVGGNGAIVNNSGTGRIRQLVLDGDTTFGGTKRLSIWGALASDGVTPDFGDYTMTVKHASGAITGNDQVRIVNSYVHTLKDVNIVQGDLAFHNADFGNAAGTITVSNDGGIKLYDSKTPYDDANNDLNKDLDFTGGEVYVYRGKFTINATSGTVTLNTMATTFNVYSYHSTYKTQLWIDGLVTGDGGITKTGNGLFRLTAANDYTGATTVADGTLRIDGSITSNTTVNSGAHLDGAGSILADVTVESGGYIEPGTSIDSLTVEGDMDIAGTWTVEYDGDTETIDVLTVEDDGSGTGDLDIGSATVNFSDIGGGAELNLPYYVFANYVTLTGEETATVTNVPDDYTVDWDFGDGRAALVPEPSALVLLSLGLIGLAACVRRRR